MTRPCDCCEGPHSLTPAGTANPPAASRLSYRAGTHGTFLETMQVRLSSKDYPALEMLRSRERSDPSMALLDAWATVADVLTFYQERIANEGYLRTATERRSVLELGRLVGYALRPGVASSVYLAYTLDKDSAPVEIPKGSLANSVPEPGEQMQGFETAEPLLARYQFSALKPRMVRPQLWSDVNSDGFLYLKGVDTKLKPGDVLYIQEAGHKLHFIKLVAADAANNRTRVELAGFKTRDPRIEGWVKALVDRFSNIEAFGVRPEATMTKNVLTQLNGLSAAATEGSVPDFLFKMKVLISKNVEEAQTRRYTILKPWVEQLQAGLLDLEARMNGEVGILSKGAIDALTKPKSLPPASAKQIERSANALLKPGSDAAPKLLTVLQPSLAPTLYPYLQNVTPSLTPPTVYAFRVVAAPFGHNAPLRLIGIQDKMHRAVMAEWEINDPLNTTTPKPDGGDEGGEEQKPPPGEHHEPLKIFLDNDYDVADGTFVAIFRAEEDPNKPFVRITNEARFVHRSLSAYGLSGKTLEVNLTNKDAWIPEFTKSTSFVPARTTRVYAGSEQLELADLPVEDEVFGSELQLGEVYQGLEAGRWLIVAGERTDIPGVKGLRGAELVVISAVTQGAKTGSTNRQPAELLHTTIKLDKELAYTYKRDTVTIYGNVVRATHGETRREILGNGDAAKAFQTFALKQWPLTYVSAQTVSGVESTLEVRINDVKWHEAGTLAELGPKDRKFLTRTVDDNKTSVVFGDGYYGQRLPTGPANVSAVYRSGIGKPGNVKAQQITLLGSRPLGVKEVTNPIRASGGADREDRDQARKNVPLALMALDRLVSTADYAFFARTFAGIGKASARRSADGHQQRVQVAIAGAGDIPIEETSDLYRNLHAALRRFGDPYLPIELIVRDRRALVISASVKIGPDYLWDAVEPKIRAALLERFGFERMDLGTDVLLSDAIDAIQRVRGVVYSDVDVFDTVCEQTLIKSFVGGDTTDTAGNTLPGAPPAPPAPAAPAAPAGGTPTNQPVPKKTPVPWEFGRHDRIRIDRAQLAYLVPESPESLILQEIKP